MPDPTPRTYPLTQADENGHEDHGSHSHAHDHAPISELRHDDGEEHGHSHGGGHGHAHGGVDAALLGSREAMRTLGLSLVILGVTAALQVGVFIVSGSIALLADTTHNVGDALTAVPLAVAFTLARRLPTRRLTYGYGRVEDFAGIAVVLVILISAIVAAYEAIDRLINPHTPGHLLITALAGVIGFIGNEWVAVYRIRSGKRIGSAALEADGHHARIDGFTSLAVVAGVIGVALGAPIADPLVGLLISLAIIRIVWTSAREVGLRALDGIEPEVIDEIREQAAATPGVEDVQDVRARWLGHVIRAELAISVPPEETAREAAATAQAVRERLTERVRHVAGATVEVRTPATA
jgi:cation diffusion facilitator family transporter